MIRLFVPKTRTAANSPRDRHRRDDETESPLVKLHLSNVALPEGAAMPWPDTFSPLRVRVFALTTPLCLSRKVRKVIAKLFPNSFDNVLDLVAR